MQPNPRIANYSNSAKTIAYYENESFASSIENPLLLIGDKGTVSDTMNSVILLQESSLIVCSTKRLLRSFHLLKSLIDLVFEPKRKRQEVLLPLASKSALSL